MTDKPLFIGLHPDYARRPEVKIVYSLEARAELIAGRIDCVR